MANQDPTPKPFDGVLELFGAYDALADLMSVDDKAWPILTALNKQLRTEIDKANEMGLVT